MNQNEVSKIGAVGSEPAKRYQAESQTQKVQTSTQPKPAVEIETKTAVQAVGGTRVSFQVDSTDSDVTITVTDKDSGRVIRTIPFDEMKDLSSGELFHYLK